VPSASKSPPDFVASRQDVGSLQRGLAILDLIVRAERPLTTSEIGSAVNLSPSTTHRLLKSLSELGYLMRDAAKRYSPSARAMFPMNLLHPLNALRRNYAEELIALRQQFGLTVALVLFIGGKRRVLETFTGNDSFSPYQSTEDIGPLHSTASGKIFLACLSPAEREAVLGKAPYEVHTPLTITTREALDAELAAVRVRGYSSALDENIQGISAVGAPIWCSADLALGALIITGASKHFEPPRLQAITQAVVQRVDLFSRASSDIRAVCRLLGHVERAGNDRFASDSHPPPRLRSAIGAR
jgi:DNA-binding IclR family transcriptional regulator